MKTKEEIEELIQINQKLGETVSHLCDMIEEAMRKGGVLALRDALREAETISPCCVPNHHEQAIKKVLNELETEDD